MGQIKNIATQAQEYGIDITGMPVSQVLKLIQDMIDFEKPEEEPEEFTAYIHHAEPTTNAKSDTDELLNSRSIYGSFKDKAEWIQEGKQSMRRSPKWKYLDAAEKEALDNIMQKMGRVLYGEFHEDNWADIAGYATLVLRHD